MKSQEKRIEETLKFIRNEGYHISSNEFLQKIAQFLTDLLEIKKYHAVIGWSFGGSIALKISIDFPGFLNKIVYKYFFL